MLNRFRYAEWNGCFTGKRGRLSDKNVKNAFCCKQFILANQSRLRAVQRLETQPSLWKPLWANPQGGSHLSGLHRQGQPTCDHRGGAEAVQAVLKQPDHLYRQHGQKKLRQKLLVRQNPQPLRSRRSPGTSLYLLSTRRPKPIMDSTFGPSPS